MTDLRVAALALARKGIPVFPLDAEKKPTCKNGFHDATTDRDGINAFRWDKASAIGQAIEQGVFVVDIDPRSSGDQTIEALEKAGLSLPTTRVHTTKGGGWHRFYRLPDEHAGSRLRGKLGPGVDIKAGGKGYVVVPPSPGYEVEHNGQPVEAPEWMVNELVKEPAATDHSMGSLPKFFDVFEVGTEYGKKAMEGEIGRLLLTPVGERNNALNRAAFSLAQLSAGGELYADEALSRLEEAGKVLTDDEEEIEQTIRSGWEAGLLEPREAPQRDRPVVDLLPKPTVKPSEKWTKWKGVKYEPPPFYCWPLLPKDSYVLMYGTTESSKSMVLMALAAEGSRHGLKSSIYSLENPKHIDIGRIQRWDPEEENFRLTNNPLDLCDPRQVQEFIEDEQAWDTDLLIVDTYSHAFRSRSEDENSKAIDFAVLARHVMSQVGCTFIIVDHVGYSDHGEPRGASAKRQQVDMSVKFTRPADRPWQPGQPSYFIAENTKSARLGNPFTLHGSIHGTGSEPLALKWAEVPNGEKVEWRS